MSRPMDELQQLLKNLHLRRMAESLPDELQRAEKEGLAYTDLLLRLVRAQWHHRQETALEWRIRQARLPERWALETFPFKDQPGVNKRQIMSLAELDFIPTALALPDKIRAQVEACRLAKRVRTVDLEDDPGHAH